MDINLAVKRETAAHCKRLDSHAETWGGDRISLGRSALWEACFPPAQTSTGMWGRRAALLQQEAEHTYPSGFTSGTFTHSLGIKI